MNARLALAMIWLLLGIGLLAEGINEVSQWSAEESLSGSSLRWWNSTGIVPGVMSIVLAQQLYKAKAFAKYLGNALAVALTVYVFYILALTPADRIVRPTLILQILVIALCLATVVLLYRDRPRP